MGLDTKTYWLTDRQSQCDFDFGFDVPITRSYREIGRLLEMAVQGDWE
jgi:hypothetical protein